MPGVRLLTKTVKRDILRVRRFLQCKDALFEWRETVLASLLIPRVHNV